ncbi:hypothetical protein A5661_03260 [Mycobacterium asiaticum]|nr:hypothetical protein A5661_03260 [Mycobacterium asiaticum]
MPSGERFKQLLCGCKLQVHETNGSPLHRLEPLHRSYNYVQLSGTEYAVLTTAAPLRQAGVVRLKSGMRMVCELTMATMRTLNHCAIVPQLRSKQQGRTTILHYLRARVE